MIVPNSKKMIDRIKHGQVDTFSPVCYAWHKCKYLKIEFRPLSYSIRRLVNKGHDYGNYKGTGGTAMVIPWGRSKRQKRSRVKRFTKRDR